MIGKVAEHDVGSFGLNHERLARDEDGFESSRDRIPSESPENPTGTSSIPLEDPAEMFDRCGHPLKVCDNYGTHAEPHCPSLLGQNRDGGRSLGFRKRQD